MLLKRLIKIYDSKKIKKRDVNSETFTNVFQKLFEDDRVDETIQIKSLIDIYNESTPRYRAAINSIFVAICGWQLTTILKDDRLK